jgi:ATP-dependent helicase HrpA
MSSATNAVDARHWRELKAGCLLRDRHRLHRQWEQLSRRGDASPEAWAQWHERVSVSMAALSARIAALPVPTYPEGLPVVAERERILAAIRDHQVVIIAGETGSGKTTQLPKMCLELGRGAAGLIGHTQPRRLAARTIADRIAQELQSPPGRIVGHKIRFQDTLEPGASIKVMTDGILLAEMSHDRYLEQYDTLIIDEAHERSLNIDFLLGYLKRLLPRRPDLKLIITSATIDPQRFSRHFGDAPVLEVSGRTYPVDVLYRPLDGDGGAPGGDEPSDDESRLENAILAALTEIDEIERAEPGVRPGGVLVFLPGEGEIRRVAARLRREPSRIRRDILPLYSRLAASDQNRIFSEPTGRRIVLSTNVAETSVTVPHIGYVIDTGLVRMSRYSVRTKMQRLPVEPVSQASARQRAGRCGRLSPGVCIRLYAESDWLARPAFTDPEIHRTHLASVILQMAGLGLGTVQQFPFIDPPDDRQVNDGYRLLEEIGALDRQRALTDTGRELLRFPLDPRLARVVTEASRLHCLHEALVIVSALSVPDIWLRTHDSPHAGDEARKPFEHERSDFLTHVTVWGAIEVERAARSGSAFRKWLLATGISYLRYNEWREVHRQLLLITTEAGWRLNDSPATYEMVHRALLCGFLTQIGMREEEREYRGTRGRRFLIQRSSSQHARKPKWIMAAEIVETRSVQARCVAAIEPDWVESLAAPLLRLRHFEPHWEKHQAAAVAFEETSLYGLVLTPRRRVQLSRIDPVQARELFIRHALVAGDYASRAACFTHNRDLLARVDYLEDKIRRRDLRVDDELLHAWFDERLPAHVCNGAGFEKWYRHALREQPALLCLQESDVYRSPDDAALAQAFPDTLQQAGTPLRVEYHFEPGRQEDGLTIEVPVALVNQVNTGALEWLVPALEKEKVTALIRSLPKALRKHFVPAPQVAEAFLASGPDRAQPLVTQLTSFLRRQARVDLIAAHFRFEELPAHLRAKVRVLGEQGVTLAQGSDVATLQRDTRDHFRAAVTDSLEPGLRGRSFTAWDFGSLPTEQVSTRGALVIRTYPAIVDKGDSVVIDACDNPDDAVWLSRGGVLRLVMLACAGQVRQWVRQPPFPDKTLVQYAHFGSREDLGEGYARAVLHHAVLFRQHLPQDRVGFDALLKAGRERIGDSGDAVRQAVASILLRYHRIMLEMSQRSSPAREACHADVRHQLKGLLPPRWLAVLEPDDIMNLPRYLEAVEVRLARLQGHVDRDEAQSRTLREWESRWQRLLSAWEASGDRTPAAVLRFRWLLEEWRVGLFAQGVKTLEPVSEKRISQRFSALESPLTAGRGKH